MNCLPLSEIMFSGTSHLALADGEELERRWKHENQEEERVQAIF